MPTATRRRPIVVLEDTDGDGRADSSHVFVRSPGSSPRWASPSSTNQVIVSNAPDLIVYTDVDRNAARSGGGQARGAVTGFNGATTTCAALGHVRARRPVYFSQGNAGAISPTGPGTLFASAAATIQRCFLAHLYSWKRPSWPGPQR